jgi:hypothetical protein
MEDTSEDLKQASPWPFRSPASLRDWAEMELAENRFTFRFPCSHLRPECGIDWQEMAILINDRKSVICSDWTVEFDGDYSLSKTWPKISNA